MPPKTGAVSNVIETLREPVRNIKRDVVKQVGNIPLDLVRMLYIDPEHKFRTEGEIEQIENHDKMARLEGFKQARRELDAMQGKVVSEETIGEETRKYIEEEEKRLARNLQKYDVASKDTAESLGQEAPQAEAQVEEQKKVTGEHEQEKKKAEEKQRLEMQIESPPGRVTGLIFKRKKSASRMLRPPKSAESKIGRGVGG